nr:MAG TPA_asm: hypothetical protein [Caudoviricetes sp.]
MCNIFIDYLENLIEFIFLFNLYIKSARFLFNLPIKTFISFSYFSYIITPLHIKKPYIFALMRSFSSDKSI